MPLLLLALLGIGGYVWYQRRHAAYVAPPLLQAGPVTVGPITQSMPVRMVSDAIVEELTQNDNHVPAAQIAANGTATGNRQVFKAGSVVNLIPDVQFIGSELVEIQDSSGGHWVTFAKDFHWVPA